jgi:hypothetical protein
MLGTTRASPLEDSQEPKHFKPKPSQAKISRRLDRFCCPVRALARAIAKSEFLQNVRNSRILVGEDKLRPYEKPLLVGVATMPVRCVLWSRQPCVHPCDGKTSKHCLVHWVTTLRLPWCTCRAFDVLVFENGKLEPICRALVNPF